MQLNNPIFINQTDADIRYVNTTGDTINGNLIANNLVYNTGNQIISGIKDFIGPVSFFQKNSHMYDMIKTGQITICSGLGPFERRVYSGNLGVLNNPNEAAVIFSYTGIATNSKTQSIERFYKRAIGSSISEGTHIEPINVSSSSVTNYSFPGFGGGTSNVSNLLSLAIFGIGVNMPILYVSKNHLNAETNTIFAGFNGIISGNGSLVNFSNSLGPPYPSFPTGFTYIDRQNQYGTGFLVGFYQGPFSAAFNPFNIASSNDSFNTQTGCPIIFESAWLSDGPNNESWLNMAFRNYGPSGIGRAGAAANPTGLTLNVYAID